MWINSFSSLSVSQDEWCLRTWFVIELGYNQFFFFTCGGKTRSYECVVEWNAAIWSICTVIKCIIGSSSLNKFSYYIFGNICGGAGFPPVCAVMQQPSDVAPEVWVWFLTWMAARLLCRRVSKEVHVPKTLPGSLCVCHRLIIGLHQLFRSDASGHAESRENNSVWMWPCSLRDFGRFGWNHSRS